MKRSSRPNPLSRLPGPDAVLCELDNALRTLFAPARSTRPTPGCESPDMLDERDQRAAARLMRVDHAGEVCAQALYRGQIAVARDERVKRLLQRAAHEEVEHLAWTEQRLSELGARTSVLNPIWYANSFLIGMVSGLAGDRWSLGFLAETERQVEAHLQSHLERLPAADARSRAIVEQMKSDEAGHAGAARRQGARTLPGPVKKAMQAVARVMTGTAHWV